MFKINEIALYFRPGSEKHLMDCTIIRGLEMTYFKDRTTGKNDFGECYGVDFGDFKGVALPQHLRKKPKTTTWEAIEKEFKWKPEKEIG